MRHETRERERERVLIALVDSSASPCASSSPTHLLSCSPHSCLVLPRISRRMLIDRGAHPATVFPRSAAADELFWNAAIRPGCTAAQCGVACCRKPFKIRGGGWRGERNGSQWWVHLIRVFIPTIIFTVATLNNVPDLCPLGSYPNASKEVTGSKTTWGYVTEMTWTNRGGFNSGSSSSVSYNWFTGGGDINDEDQTRDSKNAGGDKPIKLRYGITGNLASTDSKIKTNYLKRFKFDLKIETAGNYRFWTKSDDGSRLLVKVPSHAANGTLIGADKVSYSTKTASSSTGRSFFRSSSAKLRDLPSYTVPNSRGMGPYWRLVVSNGGTHASTAKEGIVENMQKGTWSFLLDFFQGSSGHSLYIKYVIVVGI